MATARHAEARETAVGSPSPPVVAASPALKRDANIRIGTASWTDKGLVASGKFYPPGCTSPEARLRFYASRFPIVEVDSSYYAMPSARNAQLWVERTPANFIFNIKAFRALTHHQTPPAALPPDLRHHIIGEKNVYANDLPGELVDELWRRYAEAIGPLANSGKLGAVHFQFPPWFTASRPNRAYLAEIRRRLYSHTLAIEFRHRSWFAGSHRADTLALERELGFVNVVVDEPQGWSASIPAIWEITTPALAILRLHGRNHATWTKKGLASSAERFNYDYSDSELSEFVSPVRELAQGASSVHVILNNNFEDQGQRNAATLMELFDASLLPVP